MYMHKLCLERGLRTNVRRISTYAARGHTRSLITFKRSQNFFVQTRKVDQDVKEEFFVAMRVKLDRNG